jgi:acetoin utilization deacetylase AcuC-like enzyme
MVAAQSVLDSLDLHILILDLDHHYGDGTADIIERTACTGYVDHASGFSGDPEEIISDMRSIISDSCAKLVFYQAGADSHVDDRCGGKFTTDQLYRRDLAVFTACRDMDIPVVWNLAGGYQSMDVVVDLHENTMKACVEVYCV